MTTVLSIVAIAVSVAALAISWWLGLRSARAAPRLLSHLRVRVLPKRVFRRLWRHPNEADVGRLLFVAGAVRRFSHRRDIARHRAWMTRAYALALGAGTQVFTQGVGKAIFGTSEVTTDLCLGAAWAINLAIAEYAIRRPAGRRRASRRSISRPTIEATAKVGSW